MIGIGGGRSIGLGLGTARAGGAALWYRAGGAPLPVAAYQPIGAASLVASYINLANPGTYDAAPGVAPTWASATGWQFNSITYLMSGIAPAQGWTVIVSYNNFSVNGYKFFFGEYVSGRSIILGRGASVGFDYWNGSGQLITGAEAPVSAVVAVAGQTAYRNGSAETGTIPAWVGGSGVNLYIGKYRGADFGAIVNFAAVAIYNATLSAAQVLAVSNAMAALTG